MIGIRNDGAQSLPFVAELLARDGIHVRYGEIALVVQQAAVVDARRYVAQIPDDHVADIMRSVERDLRHEAHRGHILKGRSPARVNRFVRDMILRAALHERQSA